ncbi:hypothetical protein B0H14DRAFT_1585487 [Mycena olivaceomarginata]|nr:hypothetical protein B0H14DRAFT_1585487 [Mycena olivaceomarginata]
MMLLSTRGRTFGLTTASTASHCPTWFLAHFDPRDTPAHLLRHSHLHIRARAAVPRAQRSRPDTPRQIPPAPKRVKQVPSAPVAHILRFRLSIARAPGADVRCPPEYHRIYMYTHDGVRTDHPRHDGGEVCGFRRGLTDRRPMAALAHVQHEPGRR